MADLTPVPPAPVTLPPVDNSKHIILSKTIWVNALGLLSMLVPAVHTFMVAQPELMVGAFTIVNMLLRLITKGEVYFSDDSSSS